MKSQRRHDLKTNTLAEALANLPNTRWKNFATTLTVALACILVFLLVRYRMTVSADRQVKAVDSLAQARMSIDELRSQNMIEADPSQWQLRFEDTSRLLDAVLASAGDSNPELAAEALIARGDLDWSVSNLASSTTQPSMHAQSAGDLLKDSQAAYAKVVAAYPGQSFSVCAAHFGLAAIAENQGEWDTARKEYQAVINDAQLDDLFHSHAKVMLSQVDKLTQAPVIGKPVPPATLPAVSPTIGPALPTGMPATLPTTRG